MNDLKFMDGWLYEDERGMLDAWESVVDGLRTQELPPGAVADGAAMLESFDLLRAQGWMELGLSAEAGPVMFGEAVKRLHRRGVPLPVPMLEIWLAGRVLNSMTGSEDARELRAGLQQGGDCVVLSVDDLCKPQDGDGSLTTGWIPYGDAAPFLLPVTSGEGVRVYLVPPSAGDRVRAPNPDPTISACRVTLRGTDGLRLVGELAGAKLARARADALAGQAASMVGQAQSMLDTTLSYLRVREQFGVPIGSFQALKHRAADLVSDLHAANLLSGYVAAEMVEDADLGPLAYMAKALCGRVALRVASEAIQLHGGIGFTWECDIHFGYKRCVYLAMSGLSVAECESALGRWAMDAPALRWSTE